MDEFLRVEVHKEYAEHMKAEHQAEQNMQLLISGVDVDVDFGTKTCNATIEF